MPYECFTDDGAAPLVLATNLETGDVIGVCPDHLVDYAVGLLESVTGVTWRPEVGSVPDAVTDDESDEDDAADPAGPPDARPTFPEGDDEDQADDDDDDPADADEL